MNKAPLAISVSKVPSPTSTIWSLLARSTSHSVAVHDGCTNIPLAAGKARLDETILSTGF